MFLGALLDAGVPLTVLEDAVAALRLGARLRVEKVDRSGISAAKVHVMEGEEPAESKGRAVALPARGGSGADYQNEAPELTPQLQTQHLHKGGHAHAHNHSSEELHERSHDVGDAKHGYGRSLTVIRELIQSAELDGAVKAMAIKTFELLGASEAKIHNVAEEQIHFHEVGAVDAIVDIVAASAGIHHLKVGKWFCSAVNVGGGMVECAHGTFPVPAPATADLLRGVPTYSAHLQKELVTPTGAALLRAIEPAFGVQPAMRVEAIGYGAGTRNPAGFPNVLRLSIGESAETDGARGDAAQTVRVLETALDDLSPQVLAYVAETALAKGALDVMLTPVIMKKGRPGTLLTVLCNPAESAILERLILSETSTLGLRIRTDRRVCLERSFVAVETEFGTVRMKVGTLGGEELNAAPEFEDCKAAALAHGVALKQVQMAAIAAYRAL
jgi:uncharacterized protein (TIGR00299 family) protein